MTHPLLTINPSSGLILLALKGNIVPFPDIGQFEIFLNKLRLEVESAKEFIGRPKREPITKDYANDVIESWERHLRGEAVEQMEYDQIDPMRKTKPNNKHKGKKPMTQTNEKPQQKQTGRNSKSRVNNLKKYSMFSVPDGWDPDELSLVLPQIAITDYEGAEDAKNQGHFVINVAEEILSNADAKIPVQPG